MKFTNLIFVLSIFSSSTIAQTELLETLPCKTWGSPDWQQFEDHLTAKADGQPRTGARIREFDPNIRTSIPNIRANYIGDEIYLRWILEDTTVHYDVVIKNDNDELIYKTTLNKCGVKLPMDLLIQDTTNGIIVIFVDKNRKIHPSGPHMGIQFVLSPLKPDDKKSIKAKISKEVNTDKADLFLIENLPLDALTNLEYLIEQNPNDEKIVKRFWKAVNEFYISKYK